MIQKRTYFKDFDFVKLEGVDSIEKNDSINLIEVFKEDAKFTIKVNSFKYFSASNEEVFIKKNGFYYNYREYIEDDPNVKVKETFFLKDGIGMKFVLSYDDNKPDFCRISEINFKKNEIKVIELYGKHVKPSSDLTFDKLKDNEDISFISIINISEENGKFVNNLKRFDFETKEKTNSVSYYTGYPDSKVNQFWNLYLYYFGGETR